MTDDTVGVVPNARSTVCVEAAIAADQSLRTSTPDVQVDLSADDAFGVPHGILSNILPIDGPHRSPKSRALLLSRSDRAVFLHADIRCIADLRDTLTILDRFDIAMAHGPLPNSRHVRAA